MPIDWDIRRPSPSGSARRRAMMSLTASCMACLSAPWWLRLNADVLDPASRQLAGNSNQFIQRDAAIASEHDALLRLTLQRLPDAFGEHIELDEFRSEPHAA